MIENIFHVQTLENVILLILKEIYFLKRGIWGHVKRQFCGIRRYFCMLIEMRSHLFCTFILIWYVQENKISWAWLRDLNTEGQQTGHWILNSLRLYYRYSITSILYVHFWIFPCITKYHLLFCRWFMF
jgi:hypothetical protein